jgi:predicted metal-binding membrane protein
MGWSAPPQPDLTSRVLRHEQLLVAVALALLTAACWWFLLRGAGTTATHDMAAMGSMPPPPLGPLVLMWWLMMIAMMVPSAAPAILLYGRVRQQRGDPRIARTSIFLLGYLTVWLGFSLAAGLVQQAFAGADMRIDGNLEAGTLLIAAGLYQLSPFKAQCLRYCRSPAAFFSRHWRPHVRGAVRLGILHGLYCVGCCWLLMALLFVGGVMNLGLVLVLTLAVAGEKLLPQQRWITGLISAALLVWGGLILLA